MQKIATRVFIYASVAFGIIGILLVLTIPGKDQQSSDLNILLMRLLMACVFVILPYLPSVWRVNISMAKNKNYRK